MKKDPEEDLFWLMLVIVAFFVGGMARTWMFPELNSCVPENSEPQWTTPTHDNQ